ncbi:MAG: hypothetical protein N2Z21_01995 [Candidatus Sumerlaeaceae bacterium]|nr:hypothetical protein [Candidatus Sumerlaeaceae bacterium]
MRQLVMKKAALGALVLLLLGCERETLLPFSNVKVEIPAFTKDSVTTTSVMRVGKNIEETITLPSAKNEDVEKAVSKLQKKGWRILKKDMQVSSWLYMVEKDGIQVEMIYRAGAGATVIARRRADVAQP